MDHVREIYKKIIEDSMYMDETEKRIDKEIKMCVKSYGDFATGHEYENCCEQFYRIAAVAKEESFIVGFKYAISVMRDGCF